MQEWEALTCLQTKLQVVFGDNEDGHGFDKKEESKSNAEWTLASLFQFEVMRRYGKKGLAVGEGGSQGKLQGNSGGAVAQRTNANHLALLFSATR